MQVVDGTKDSAKVSVKKDVVETAAKYFSYEEVEVVKTTTMSSFEVEDVNKCKTYLMNLDGATEDIVTTLCNGGSIGDAGSLKSMVAAGDMPSSDYETAGLKVENVDIIIENVEVKDTNKCKSYFQTKGETEADATTLCTTDEGLSNLKRAIVQGKIDLTVYETAGLKVKYRPYTPSIKITGYNIAGETDVVIPSQIDGKTVVAIGDYAFTESGVIPTLTAYNNDYKVSLLSYNSNNNYVIKPLSKPGVIGLGITSVIIPNTVTSIGESAFRNNQIISITFPDTPITLGCHAFGGNPIMEDGSYSFPSNVTEVCE